MRNPNAPEPLHHLILRGIERRRIVLSLRRSEEKISGDQRILGSGDLVERVLRELAERFRYRFNAVERSKNVGAILRQECEKGKIGLEELRMGSRRGDIPWVRSEIAQQLVKQIGMSLGEVAWLVRVSTSAISKIIQRSLREGAMGDST
jgi:hypothetical protein